MKNLQNKSEYALVFRFIFFMTILLFAISTVNADETYRDVPNAVKGVLDLRNWDFEKDGIIPLFGEWEYYWMQNLSPQDFLDSNNKLSGYYVYPSEITNYSINGKKLTEQGFCTYRVKILLNSKQRVPLSINFDNLKIGRASCRERV